MEVKTYKGKVHDIHSELIWAYVDMVGGAKDYLIRIPVKDYKNIKKNDQIVLTCWSEENEMKYKLELNVTPDK